MGDSAWSRIISFRCLLETSKPELGLGNKFKAVLINQGSSSMTGKGEKKVELHVFARL